MGPAGEMTWAEFARVDLRAGTVAAAEPFPDARRPAPRFWIDSGPELSVRRSPAQPERPVPDGARLV